MEINKFCYLHLYDHHNKAIAEFDGVVSRNTDVLIKANRATLTIVNDHISHQEYHLYLKCSTIEDYPKIQGYRCEYIYFDAGSDFCGELVSKVLPMIRPRKHLLESYEQRTVE
jgi:hypothetical protein